ncbi:MAG TPA: GH3 auxin-responsive promoter family protein [Opitutaceae bacterium]|nr:GH3 auxin-responsive promoter family protein [Opitutaceae bacterium]
MIAAAANLLWLASHSRALARFRHQLEAPEKTQRQVLARLLRQNAGCAFGRRHGFADIRTPAEFASRVPLANYADLEPWIRELMRGERSVLTTEEPTHLVPTSGSTRARKLIPFTATLQREFDAAIGPWIVDLFRTCPGALFGPAYWSISPAIAPEREESAVPIGFADDTSYLGGVRRWIVGRALVSPDVRELSADIEAFTLHTLACLLRRRDLRLISVWHPSFLLLLLDALPGQWTRLLELVRVGSGRAREKELSRLGPNEPAKLWPNLKVISCWTDAHAETGASDLAHRFPGVAIQPKGLLATEAFVTLPFGGAHPIAIGSHYFEFLDDRGTLHSANALEVDHTYEVVVTTGGGLWRYRLGDRVRVDRFVGRTPSLRFVGRVGNVADFFGEKLSEEIVAGVIAQLRGDSSGEVRFAMLAPEVTPTTGAYVLFWEGTAPPSAAKLDSLLCANPNYTWCRQLGQLGPARVFAVESNASEVFLRRMSASGQRLGEIKISPLSRLTGWTAHFSGSIAE